MGGRSRMKKIKAMDPFSKTGGVYASKDEARFNAPPKRSKRRKGREDDDAPMRVGSLLMMPKGGVFSSGLKGGLDKSVEPSKRFKPAAAGNPVDVEPELPPVVPAPAAKPLLRMLPGETFQQFAQRVNTATREELSTNDGCVPCEWRGRSSYVCLSLCLRAHLSV